MKYSLGSIQTTQKQCQPLKLQSMHSILTNEFWCNFCSIHQKITVQSIKYCILPFKKKNNKSCNYCNHNFTELEIHLGSNGMLFTEYPTQDQYNPHLTISLSIWLTVYFAPESIYQTFYLSSDSLLEITY